MRSIVNRSDALEQFNHFNNDVQDHGSHRHDRSLGQSIGSFRVLVLLVRFTDHGDRALPPPSHFQQLCDDNIKPFLAAQSAGRYSITACDVQEWIDTDNTEAFYAGGFSNLQESNLAAAMFVPVLKKLEQEHQDWDWTTLYDADIDGNLDAVLVFHSGHAAELGSNCGNDPALPGDRIWSQGHRGSDSAWMKSDYSIGLSGFAIASAFHSCDEEGANMGTPTHEGIHTFGTPDLYDVKRVLEGGSGNVGGLGVYDIMSRSDGPNGDGIAAGMSAFVKERLGWMDPVLIQYDGVYEVKAASQGSPAYKITKGFATDGSEYLLIENREQLGYDANLPGRGLLIYHVDDSLELQDTAGYNGQSGWPANGNHYRVALLQADGKYDLEQLVNNGDAGDYWVAGMTLAPGGNGNFPNTDSYQNGKIQGTGITITDISEPGTVMTFRVSGLGSNPDAAAQADSPAIATTTTAPITPTPTTKAPTSVAPVMSPVISASTAFAPIAIVSSAPIATAPTASISNAITGPVSTAPTAPLVTAPTTPAVTTPTTPVATAATTPVATPPTAPVATAPTALTAPAPIFSAPKPAPTNAPITSAPTKVPATELPTPPPSRASVLPTSLPTSAVTNPPAAVPSFSQTDESANVDKDTSASPKTSQRFHTGVFAFLSSITLLLFYV